MQNDPDKELFSRMNHVKGFAEETLRNDTLEDWNLAKNFGEFMLRIAPRDILGHALVARACRHLGDRTRDSLFCTGYSKKKTEPIRIADFRSVKAE